MRNRTSFPGHVSFEGWWCKSKNGNTIGKLEKTGRNLHCQNTYCIIYHNVKGNGEFTTETLLEAGATITLTKPEIGHETKPPANQHRIIVRG
jgi:hypothetical protein